MALSEHDDPTLPCGRALSSVWEENEPGRTDGDAGAHAARCPYCQEALAGLGVLDTYVREARQAAVAAGCDEDDRSAERFTARVMDLVRTELRPGRTLPLGEPEDDAWITEAAAAKTFRAAAETLPGVQAGSCRVTLLAPHGPVKVALQLAAGYEWPLHVLADRVRERVSAAAWDRVGLLVAEIDVSVVDLVESEDGEAGHGGRGTDTGEAGTA
ncbi:Asp23/Gls24 family envelope stress response protein [Streptomyces sp. NPDC017529]|uniref:Asp23/Gls24 family envelope stress response protein n=1 Tax=Streptomyces sp. NPDC017529 TaxID=3365000 RepID=UPI0037969A79